jgi:hypothetical protein
MLYTTISIIPQTAPIFNRRRGHILFTHSDNFKGIPFRDKGAFTLQHI